MPTKRKTRTTGPTAQRQREEPLASLAELAPEERLRTPAPLPEIRIQATSFQDALKNLTPSVDRVQRLARNEARALKGLV